MTFIPRVELTCTSEMKTSYLRFLAIKTWHLCFCTCDAGDEKVCGEDDYWDGSLVAMWVPGARGCGRSVEMTQRKGCQAGLRTLLQPAASSSFWGETFPEVSANVGPGAAAREQRRDGVTGAHCDSRAPLSCDAALILTDYKDKLGAEGAGFQFVWRSLVRFSQGRCWGHK